MAAFYRWELFSYDTNTTAIPSYNFYSGSSSSNHWNQPKTKTVVPVSQKARNQENIQALRRDELRRERRHCIAK